MPIRGDDLIAILSGAGLVRENTQRVVIDIGVDRIPHIYTEETGDERLIEVIEAITTVGVVKP